MIQECESHYFVKTVIDLKDVRMAKKKENKYKFLKTGKHKCLQKIIIKHLVRVTIHAANQMVAKKQKHAFSYKCSDSYVKLNHASLDAWKDFNKPRRL